MKAEEVAKYLRDHPDFFEEYMDLLATIHVPHPSGKHAIPLAERQVLTLREKGRRSGRATCFADTPFARR